MAREDSFNPKREAHPLQTTMKPLGFISVWLFQSQTGSPSSSDEAPLRQNGLKDEVSIPNGSPSSSDTGSEQSVHAQGGVSIPNGKPILFRHHLHRWLQHWTLAFQSQTGSPSSSDNAIVQVRSGVAVFQSQTGSPSSSDILIRKPDSASRDVSIPNGKPILFRLGLARLRAIVPYEFQSQTGSPSSSDFLPLRSAGGHLGFNPKREAHPLQTGNGKQDGNEVEMFQSQTGSPSSSDLWLMIH